MSPRVTHLLRSLLLLPAYVLLAAVPVLADWPGDPAVNIALCAPHNCLPPTVVSDGAGGAIVAWIDNRGVYPQVCAQRVGLVGTVMWGADGVLLTSATGDKAGIKGVPDGAGGAILTWYDNRNGFYDVWAQRVNASGVAQWTANGVALTLAASHQVYPVIVSDDAGGAIVAWQDQRNGLADIYAQHVTATGAIAPGWAPNGDSLCTAATAQTRPVIAPDGAGGAIVAWPDQRAGSTIYAQRVSGAGAIAWTLDGIPASTATSGQMSPCIAPDGSGGAIIAWQDSRGYAESGWDIYAQHLTGAGAVAGGWSAAGDSLCAAAGDQTGVAAVSDGQGGAIVGWTDQRGPTRDVYGARVSGDRTLPWAGGVIAICDAAGEQMNFSIASDAQGGALFAWDDSRGGVTWDIYAARVGPSGDTPWTGGGPQAISTAANNQEYASLVAGTSGDAYIAWQDQRSGIAVYAQRVDPWGVLGSGTAGVPAAPPPAGLALSQPAPNPLRGSTTLELSLPRAAEVSLAVYDQQGRRVRVLVAGSRSAGEHAIVWDGRDEGGRAVASGVYFVRCQVEGRVFARRIAALR